MDTPVKLNPNLGRIEESRARPSAASARGRPFHAVFEERLRANAPLRFSAHAAERMAQRGIAFTAQETEQISVALDRAAAKGARESLLLLDKAVLVASVPNRTIITALQKDEAEDTVFTKIDSAVVVSAAATKNENQGPDPSWEARAPRIDRSGSRR